MKHPEMPSRASGYFARIFRDPHDTVDSAMRSLRPLSFDTIVVRGNSGLVLGSVVSYLMEKNLYIVRKSVEPSHTNARAEGNFGERWIFLDDFIASGSTVKKCHEVVFGSFLESHHVGNYCYQNHFALTQFGEAKCLYCCMLYEEREKENGTNVDAPPVYNTLDPVPLVGASRAGFLDLREPEAT